MTTTDNLERELAAIERRYRRAMIKTELAIAWPIALAAAGFVLAVHLFAT